MLDRLCGLIQKGKHHFLILIYSMLIYVVSFALQSIMVVTINNQCSDIELMPPAHLTKNNTCYIQSPQQVNSKNRVEIDFKTIMYRSTFGGVLLYHLQRKKNDESNNRADEDTAISTQLLVIWEFRIGKLYSHAWLIEHENTFVWSEDMLKKLYDVYNSQVDTEFIFDSGRWLLDNNTMLQIICKASYKRSFEMNITISEEKDLLHPTKPLWVDPNR
jgi:hypothetical protein